MRILTIMLVVVIGFLQYRLWFANDGLVHTFSLKKAISAQKEASEKIIQGNTVLMEEIDSLKKGGDAIENRARTDLGMIKKGEVFYQIVK